MDGYILGGIVSMIMGIVAKYLPKTIDSYQCAPKRNKKNIKLKELSNLYFNTFFFQGLLSVIASLCGYGKYIYIPTFVISMIIATVKSQKYIR